MNPLWLDRALIYWADLRAETDGHLYNHTGPEGMRCFHGRHSNRPCLGCLVRKRTGEFDCKGTPLAEAVDAWNALQRDSFGGQDCPVQRSRWEKVVLEVIKFLKSL